MRLLRGDGTLLRVGHRGAAALAPENTLRSFEAALTCGVDAIEFDVLDRGAGPLVLGHSLAELGREPATLDEALAFLAGHDIVLHVDLKLTTRLDEVADALVRHGLSERAVVSSFRLASLAAFANRAPRIPIGFTYPEDRYGVSRANVFCLDEPDRVPAFRAGNDRTLAFAAEAKGRLIPFVRLDLTDSPIEEAERCLDQGARGIKLHPRAQRFLLNDERLAPVFALAAERRVRGPAQVRVRAHAGELGALDQAVKEGSDFGAALRA